MDHRLLDHDTGRFGSAAHLAGNRGGTPERVREAVISEDENRDWYVYILLCSNGAFYTGVTTDVKRRVAEHDSKGRHSARFTRAFAPVELVYSCCMGAKSPAYQAEYRIKRLPRRKKELVVAKNFSKSKLLDFLELKE